MPTGVIFYSKCKWQKF